MGLENPIAAYNAATNIEAIQVANYLEANGIEAHVSQDDSLAGYWLFGRLPEIHKPQVWISKRDADRAAEFLTNFEVGVRRSDPRPRPTPVPGTSLQVDCEDCGRTSEFAAELNGTVQRCPKCWGYVDVGEFDWADEDFDEPNNHSDAED